MSIEISKFSDCLMGFDLFVLPVLVYILERVEAFGAVDDDTAGLELKSVSIPIVCNADNSPSPFIGLSLLSVSVGY